MAKPNALQKIESHEKLCRIMQKLTHDKNSLNRRKSKTTRENFANFNRFIN